MNIKRIRVLDFDIKPNSIQSLMQQIEYAIQSDPKPDKIVVEMMTNGGEVTSGLAFYDWMQRIQKEHHEIDFCVECYGVISSMGIGIILAFRHRAAGEQTKFVVHALKISMDGYYSKESLTRKIEALDKDYQLSCKIFQEQIQNSNSVRDLQRALGMDIDTTYDANKALILGLIDQIL